MTRKWITSLFAKGPSAQEDASLGSASKIEERFRWRKEYTYLSTLLAAILFMAAAIYFGGRLRDFESYGYLGIFLMGIIGSSSPVWPMPGSWAAFIAGGLGWNPFLIALAAGLGEPIGEVSGYLAGYSGQVMVKDWRIYSRVEGWMRRRGTIILFLVSAIPNWLVKAAVTAAGALRFPLWKFFLVCWAGKTIKSLGFALAGAGLFSLVADLIERLF